MSDDKELTFAGFAAMFRLGPEKITMTKADAVRLAELAQVAIAEITRLRAALKWDIERDGDDLLICEGDHERHEGCTMQRWVKAENVATARREGMEEARTIFNEAIEGTTLEGTILMRQIDAAIRAAAGEGK